MVMMQRGLLVRWMRGMQRRQMMIPAVELRRDDVLKVLQECRRLEAGIFQLWRKQIQIAAVPELCGGCEARCDAAITKDQNTTSVSCLAFNLF